MVLGEDGYLIIEFGEGGGVETDAYDGTHTRGDIADLRGGVLDGGNLKLHPR